MWTLLGTIAAAIANFLLGRFFPGHPQVTPEVIAQANKDRADTLQAQKDARNEADKSRRETAARIMSDPKHSELFKHDANELPPE